MDRFYTFLEDHLGVEKSYLMEQIEGDAASRERYLELVRNENQLKKPTQADVFNLILLKDNSF